MAPVEYDIAISFAGEDRPVARRLAKELNARYNLAVFYDDDEQARLVGKDLVEYLSDIYTHYARYCVVLISQHYRAKRWTRREWRYAQARALAEPDADYVLPVRLDDTELPGLPETTGYLDLKKLGVRRVAELLNEKVKDRSQLDAAVRDAARLYAKGAIDEALAMLDRRPELATDIEALRIKADCYGKRADYDRAVEALDVIVGQAPDDFLAHFLLGIFHYRRGAFEESVRHYELADRIAPGHPTIDGDLPLARAKLAAKRRLRRSSRRTT